MKKTFNLLFIFVFCCCAYVNASSPSFENPKRFTSEFLFGLRFPIAKQTNDDILSGFALRFGMGYQLTKNLEIFNLAFDFGSSSPQNPDYYYDYYTGLVQETVNVYGLPLTMRYRFQIKDQLDFYMGAGISYYWFVTKLEIPYYGNLKESRKRHGPGGIFEISLFTDAFSEKLLVGLTTNLHYLQTKGKTLTKPEGDVPDERVSRKDIYLNFAICARYFLGK